MTAPVRPALVIFSDLDGCLLDATTYEFEAARPALREIERTGVLLVLCSSKTRAEIEVLARRLALRAPFVAENGGEIVAPDGSLHCELPGAVWENGARVVPLGVERSILVQALSEIAAETGLELRGFSQMKPSEVAAWTGLPRHAAVFALERRYDEPFVVMGEKGRVAELAAAAERRGFVITRGGRFFHLTGRVDKGLAVRVLAAGFGTGDRRCRTAALGDAENDLSMLLAVDVPVLMPGPGGSVEGRLAQELPDAWIAPAPGPVGWNAAVLALLHGEGPPEPRLEGGRDQTRPPAARGGGAAGEPGGGGPAGRIPSFNNARTVGHVVRATAAGFAKYFPDRRAVIVNSDGGSRDGTPETVAAADFTAHGAILVAHRLNPVHKIVTPYHGLPGKGSAFRTLFSLAERLKARACAVVDSDLRSITPEWIQLLLGPVLQEGLDFVARSASPSWARRSTTPKTPGPTWPGCSSRSCPPSST